MNNLIKLSNLFNKLVQADPVLKFYHFGYLSEMNEDTENNFNQEARTGKLYPSLLWTVPDNITFNTEEPEKETIKIDLYFNDLYGYINNGAQDTRSKLEVWQDLRNIAKRFIKLFDAAQCGYNDLNFGISSGITQRLEYDFKDNVLSVVLSFDIILTTECFDVDGDTLPALGEVCDLENYKFCNIIP